MRRAAVEALADRPRRPLVQLRRREHQVDTARRNQSPRRPRCGRTTMRFDFRGPADLGAHALELFDIGLGDVIRGDIRAEREFDDDERPPHEEVRAR